MSACEQVSGLLRASIEGTLPAASRERLDGHLRECPSCRHTLADQLAIRKALGELGFATVAPDFAARVRDRVASRPWLEVVNWRIWTLRLAPLAALLALLAWLPATKDDTSSEGTLAAAMDTWSGRVAARVRRDSRCCSTRRLTPTC